MLGVALSLSKGHQLLEQHAFMRRMLVDQIQSVRSLRHQVRRTDLADEPQQRNSVDAWLTTAHW